MAIRDLMAAMAVAAVAAGTTEEWQETSLLIRREGISAMAAREILLIKRINLAVMRRPADKQMIQSAECSLQWDMFPCRHGTMFIA